MVEINTQEEDKLIKKYEDEIRALTKKDYYLNDILSPYTKDVEKERIRKIERLEDQIVEQKRMKVLKAKSNESKPNIQSIKLGDIIIIPGICFILGNCAMSDKFTFGNVRDIFEKGKVFIPVKRTRLKISESLSGGKFAGGLKFIYAIVKYITFKKVKNVQGKYKVSIDSDFLKYFQESERLFWFIGRGNTEPSLDNNAYRRANRSFAKKVLKLSSLVSILDKEKHSDYFEVELEE